MKPLSQQIAFFDIETTAADDAEMFMPDFRAPSNYKDDAKIRAYIEDSKKEWSERLALSPLTGKVLCITYKKLGEEPIILDGSNVNGKDPEVALLEHWTLTAQSLMSQGYRLMGWNVAGKSGYDVTFLQKRAWKHGLLAMVGHDFDYFRQESIVDLKTLWDGRSNEHTSLKTVARFLGVGDKSQDDGKNFGQLWIEDRARAEQYAKNDTILCEKIALKMGVI